MPDDTYLFSKLTAAYWLNPGGWFEIIHAVQKLRQFTDSLLDTASPARVMLLAEMQEKVPLRSEPAVIGMARTPHGEAKIRRARLDGTLELGKHEWIEPLIEFGDLEPMVTLDVGNIGIQLLERFAVTGDQKNLRIRFRETDSSRPKRR